MSKNVKKIFVICFRRLFSVSASSFRFLILSLSIFSFFKIPNRQEEAFTTGIVSNFTNIDFMQVHLSRVSFNFFSIYESAKLSFLEFSVSRCNRRNKIVKMHFTIDSSLYTVVFRFFDSLDFDTLIEFAEREQDILVMENIYQDILS